MDLEELKRIQHYAHDRAESPEDMIFDMCAVLIKSMGEKQYPTGSSGSDEGRKPQTINDLNLCRSCIERTKECTNGCWSDL